MGEIPQDKCKKIATNSDSPVKKLRKSEGWSQEQINQALEERIWIQATTDNLNSMLGISPLFRGVIHDVHIVPFMSYDLMT